MAEPLIDGPAGNTPSGGAGIDSSKIVSTFDVYKPQKRNELFRIRGDQGMSLFNILDSFGYTRPIQGQWANSYSEDWIANIIYIGAGGLVQDSATQYHFLLSTAATTNNYLPTSTTSPYTTAQYYPTVIKGQIVMFPPKAGSVGGNQITGWVDSISGTGNALTVTVKLSNGDNSLTAANYPAGTGLIVSSNVHSEGSDQPIGVVPKVLEDTAYLQIFKNSYKNTGTQMIMQSWFSIVPNGGGPGQDLYILKGQEDTEYLHMQQIDGAMMFGELNTNTAQIDADTGEPYYMTEGLFPYIRRTGYTQNYTPGTWTVSGFDTISKKLEREYAPKNIMVLDGFDWDVENENVMKDYFQNTNIIYAREQMARELMGGDQGLMASVGFSFLKKAGRTFAFNVMGNWTNPRLYGAAGFNTPQMAAFVPLGKQSDKKNGTSLPYLGMIYGAKGGYSRKSEVWTLAGAGTGQKVLSQDVSNLYMRSHCGAEHVGGNQMVLLEP
jgi:hypothetical protein